jgi:type IV pilus assembly protein PilA
MEQMGKLSSVNMPFGDTEMRPELQAKMIQHLLKKKGEKGFTLVELLVVIVIVGILTAIALPSFLNQTAKAKQAEAKQKVGAILKTQQSWYTEHDSFAGIIDDLALGNLDGASTAPLFTYAIVNLGDRSTSTGITAKSNETSVKSYSGRVDVTNVTGTGGVKRKAWNSIICEANTPGTTLMAQPAGVTDADCTALSARIAP